MAVPKATVYKYGGFEPWQYDVWSTGQFALVKTKSEATAMESSTHQ